MSTETRIGNLTLDVRTINPIRCDISTHSDMSIGYKDGKKTLKQNPGVVIQTDHEELAEIVKRLTDPSSHTEKTPEEPTVDPDKQRLSLAISRVVAMGPQLILTESSDVVGHRIDTLFEGLRDPGRRERTIRRVEVLYQERVSASVK